MYEFAELNGVEDTDTKDIHVNNNVDGWYVDGSGNRLPGEPMVGHGTVPENAYGVEAITYITATAFFGSIFGFDGYPVQARAVSHSRLACANDCVVPFTVDVNLLLVDPDAEEPEPRATCFNIWTERDKKPQDISSGALGWVNWTWQELVSKCTVPGESWDCWDGRACPSVSQGSGCSNVVLGGNLNAVLNCANGFVEVGDWMSAATGDMNSVDVRCWLSYYAGYVDPDVPKVCADGEPHSMTVPVYGQTTADLEGGSTTPCLSMDNPCDPTSGGLHYQVAGFARANILQYQLSHGTEVPPDDYFLLSPDTPDLEYIDSCYDYYDLNLSSCGDPDDEGYWDCVEDVIDTDGFRITIEFVEFVDDASSSSSCEDPLGTLLSSPKITQ
jgi:hypothetical protein